MDVAQAVSRSFYLAWHPEPAIYDNRSRLVELFDELAQVDRFRVAHDSVSCILADGREVEVDVHGVRAYSVFAQEEGNEALMLGQLAAAAAGLLKASPSALTVALQHLVAWGRPWSSEQAAQATGARHVLGDLAEQLGVYDVAVLADGRIGSGRTFQVEFGVVSAEEAPLRLARVIGRSLGMRSRLNEHLLERRYPPLATFVDSHWSVEEPKEGVQPWVSQEIMAAEREAGRLVAGIHERMVASAESERAPQ